MKKSRIILVLVVGLALGFGCAKPDWIEQTLVTVDVTGTWQTTEGALFVLGWSNRGQRSRGHCSCLTPPPRRRSGPIDGGVAGDVFRFKLTNGDNATFGSADGHRRRNERSV